MRMHRPLLTLALFPLLALAAAAQAVRVVDVAGAPGADFESLTAAITAASPGDVLLVRGGTYDEAPPPIDRSLTIVVDEGATATLTNDLVVLGLPAGEHVLVSGLTVDAVQGSLSAAVEIFSCAGSVTLVDCAVFGNLVDPNGNGDGLVAVGSDSVTLVRTSITAREVITLNMTSSTAVRVSGSTVALYDCALVGGDGTPGSADSPFPLAGRTGGAALLVTGSAPASVLVAGSTLTGGVGGQGGVGVFLPGACTDGGLGGAGLLLDAPQGAVTLVDTVLAGGAGGASPSRSCSVGATGPASEILSGSSSTLAPSGRSLELTPLVRESETLEQTFRGPAGERVLVSYSLFAGSADFVPSIGGTLLVQSPFLSRFLGFLPASGVLERPVLVPELGPGFEGLRLFVQAYHLDLVNLLVFASSPSPTVLLDGGF